MNQISDIEYEPSDEQSTIIITQLDGFQQTYQFQSPEEFVEKLNQETKEQIIQFARKNQDRYTEPIIPQHILTLLKCSSPQTFEIDDQSVEGKQNFQMSWILCSILAGVSWGVANCFTSRISHLGFQAPFLIFPGIMIGSLAFHLYQYFFGDGNNIRERFPMNDEESFAFSFKGLLLNVFLSLFTDFLVIFIFSYSIKSGINTGIITALFSFSTIFTSIIFSNFYGEKLNPTHKFGILMMFICSICITIGSLNKETSSDSTYISNSDILFTIMLASIAPVLFSVKSAVFRYNSDNGVNPKYQSVDYLFCGSFLFFLLGLVLYGYELNGDLLLGVLGGILDVFGVVLIGLAFSYGIGAIVQSLILVQSLIQTFLEMMFFDQNPNFWEFMGLMVGVCGTCFLYIYNKNTPNRMLMNFQFDLKKSVIKTLLSIALIILFICLSSQGVMSIYN